ncbi:hypothetical protein SKAU_G00257760 [Synaphobranchus kaupii]|uniref:Uncharacterized protein n=1 Tax=Synaphobranchus kaupii TaxID=118154 RepID=A0A9Q1IRL5_SYNKA|nr:hypothetical protein SKAU_G00257760 [Synaphobranchus kaupii]
MAAAGTRHLNQVWCMLGGGVNEPPCSEEQVYRRHRLPGGSDSPGEGSLTRRGSKSTDLYFRPQRLRPRRGKSATVVSDIHQRLGLRDPTATPVRDWKTIRCPPTPAERLLGQARKKVTHLRFFTALFLTRAADVCEHASPKISI